MQSPFAWDENSDQPYQLKNRAFKKSMRKKKWVSLCLTHCIMPLLLPFFALRALFLPKRNLSMNEFFALCIAYEHDHKVQTQALLQLPAMPLLVRIGLWQMDELKAIKAWLQTLHYTSMLIVIMQDREHIDDPALLQKNITIFFETFSPLTQMFQIGSTINRSKWGFFSMNEYIHFFTHCHNVRKQQFPSIKLLGPSVIDFEYHFTLHALLFLRRKIDILSALLYVDRRGAPENRQLGCDLPCKINLLDALRATFLPEQPIFITETNWPLSNTAPFAPTSEYECVDEDEYLKFMLRYYFLALSTQKVERIYWHQLIASGYGLIDAREIPMRKRDAFNAFAFMVKTLQETTLIEVSSRPYYQLCFSQADSFIHVLWALSPCNIAINHLERAYNALAQPIETHSILLSDSPIYIFSKEQRCAS